MSTLTQTIGDSLARLGSATEEQLRDIFEEIAGFNLGEDERLSVLATAIAAAASIYHQRHKRIYLEAVRTWALEISVNLAPPPPRLTRLEGAAPIEEAAEIIITGLEALLDGVRDDPALVQDRLVLELALFAQLLGRHDANAVHLTWRAVADAIGDEEYRPGRVVRVPLDEIVLPLARDACLATVPVRGMA